ncbi:unnamed protein product [Effrenium voratum]|nr:unnamed protein product [Effrenium voratum]
MALLVGQVKSSRNASATMAFQKYRQESSQKDDEADSRASHVKINIEFVESKFRAKLHLEVAKSFGVFGPLRESRPEAINDGVEMGKAFVSEGALGARRVAASLTSRKWSLKEIENADESRLEGFVIMNQGPSPDNKKRQIPRGEGWVRHDDVTVINPQSQVLFLQEGARAGAYCKQDPSTKKLVEIGEPHVPQDFKAAIRGATASWIRKGVKMDRAVLLNDITKIARLALKFPLSFVDTPACAYALFQGLRNAESAQWCAENFHKKLLPFLAEQIHTYDTVELRKLLERTLEALDSEILKSAHAFTGCSAVLVLVLGERIVMAGVGHVRVVLLPEKGSPRELLACTGSLDDAFEIERVRNANGIIRDGLLYGILDGLDEATRILNARSVFEVLQLDPGGPLDEKQVRTAYRKLALRPVLGSGTELQTEQLGGFADRRPPLKEITAPEDGPGASPAASQRPGSQAASNITQAERRSSFSTLTDVQAKLETGGIREPEAQLGVTQTNSIAGESGHADEVRAHSSQEDSARSGDADAGMATAGEAPNAEARAEQARLQAQAAQAEQILQVQADVESADKEIEQLMEALRKAKEAKEAEAKEVEPKEPEELPELEPSPQSSSHFQRIVSGSSAGTSDAHSPRRHSGLLDDSQDADHTMMSYIKAEGRKKKRMLQMRNVKFKLLQKLLEQAGLIKDLHLQNGEPETDEERGKRLQQDLKAAHERNRRLSQQLDFWGTRIDQRKDQLDEEKKHLRKEFGRNWESKLERALLGTEEDPESEATSETSESEEENNTHGERGTAGQQPESKQPGEESVRLVPGKRNQVVGKTYSKERPRVRRRAPDEREHPREPREELPGTLQRKPLASFGAARGEDMEDVVLQGRRQSYSSRRSSQTSDDSNSRVSEDLDPHDRGSLADHIVKVMGNAPKSQSYLEGLNRLRPSAQYYTYGKRREVPGQKKRSKRRVSIRSFVEDLSDDGTDRERRRPSTASLLPEGFDARGRTLRGNSRLSRASVESRSAFSDGDQGELQQLVQEAAEEEHKGVNAAEWLQKALALRQESRKRSKGSTLAAPVHLETVRLLRTAAKMSMKRQVAADDLLGANLLRAQHMNVTSAGQKSKQIFQADAAFREMAERRKVEAEAWTQRLASGTARSRYAATKAKLLAMEGLETRRPPLPKKEALRRLFRAKTTSPAQSEGFIRSRGRSQAKSRSKQVLDNFENALGKARNSDAHREIARMKVMSLHHSAMRRRFLQNYSSEEEEEDEVVHRRSIMMLAEDESPNRPGRKGLIGASPERAVSKPLQGLTTALNEGVQDEKVAEVAAKWLGERPYDDRESMIVDASAHVEQTEAPALASFGAFRPSRRMKARTMGPRSQSRRRSEEGSSSGSEDSYPSTSRRTDRSNASPDGDENVHFRNVAYFIDLMNENDSHKHRKRKSSRRRRKALRQQRMQASRADVRWHSHMLKLLELRLGTSRPQASGHVSDESPSDCDSSRSPARRHGPPPLPRKLAARARTAPNTQVEAPRAESPKPPAKTGGTENSSLKTMARDDGLRQSERTQACPKSVQMKLEEGGWSRLKSPALPQAQDAHRPLQGTQPSPWWGRRHDTRQARFAASTARVNFNDTDADAKERDRQLRAQKWVQVGAQMGVMPSSKRNEPEMATSLLEISPKSQQVSNRFAEDILVVRYGFGKPK